MKLSPEQIQIIIDYFADKPVEHIYLFGSYARGDANANSDIDLAFIMKKGTRISYFGLAQYLIDLEKRLNKKVDIVEKDFLYPRIKDVFEIEKKMIF
jgi:hypothetical protein